MTRMRITLYSLLGVAFLATGAFLVSTHTEAQTTELVRTYELHKTCTGPLVVPPYGSSDFQDTGKSQVGLMGSFTRNLLNGPTNPPTGNIYGEPPADLQTNPEGYCSSGAVGQQQGCTPPTVCGSSIEVELHAGTGTTDAPPYNGPGGSRTTYGAATIIPATNAPPTVDLTARPLSIQNGASSTLTWTSRNATSCTGNSTDFNTGNATENTSGLAVYPREDRTYEIICTGPGGTASDTVDIDVTQPAALNASCSPSKTPVAVGEVAQWNAYPTGGTGSYTYSWSGTDNLSGSAQYITHIYSAEGQKTARVTVTSGGQSVSSNCEIALTVNETNSNALSCSAVTPSPKVNEPITFEETSAAPNYGLSWSDSNGTKSTGVTATRTYNAPGTYTMTVSRSGYDNGMCSVTVGGAAELPDLIASNVSASDISGLTATLNAVITNQDPVQGTVIDFTNRFIRATNANGDNATHIGTADSRPRGPLATSNISISETFPSAGTWYVKACADESVPGDDGVVDEDREDNNCSPNWTPITVGTAQLSCTVDDRRPVVGQNVTYTASGGTGGYTWDASDNNVNYGSGSTVTRSFPTAGNYSMTVTNSGNTRTCPAVVARDPGEPEDCGNPLGEISASPERVREGSTSTLSFSADGVDGSCRITGPTVNYPITPTSCLVNDDTIETGALVTQSVFILECDGEEVDRTIVNVVPSFEEF